MTLPLAMGLGALALAPFGPEYATRGVLAGLYAAAFLGLVAVMMGARGVAIYAPRSLVSFMVAAVSADLFLYAPWLPKHDPELVMAAMFMLLSLAGAFQLAFGLARLARIVKFIPTPVMAGFQIAASTIIMLSQLPILLGLKFQPTLSQWPGALGQVKPLSAVVAAATLVVVFNAGRITSRVPPLVVALFCGTLLYYFFVAMGLAGWLGSTLGHIPIGLPDGHDIANMMFVATLPGFRAALPDIVLGAASIALVASLDVLISAKIVENLSRKRGNGTQELISIGGANLVAPLMGGIAGSISLASTTTAVKGGARSSLALITHSLVFLALVPLAAGAIGYLPRVVIATLVFYAGTQLFDRWTLGLLRRLATHKAVHWRGIVVDLLVISIVALVALSGEIVAAVLIGITVAGIVFTLRMSRGIVRREQYGDMVQSRRTREAGDAAVLADRGRSILAVELEGPLFFGSAEMLHNRVDAAIAEGVRFIAIDVSRVTELDSTGARILLQADERLRASGCSMALCGGQARPELAALFADHGVSEALTGRMLPDLDRGLEWCENAVLATRRTGEEPGAELAFELLEIVRGMEGEELEAVRGALVRREYAAGETVFRLGDEGDALYVIAAGSASAWLQSTRLLTFSRGTFFGEMAVLDFERRSATVTADEPLVCYVLDRESFHALSARNPGAGMGVLSNMGRELSRRMRRANRTMMDLA